MCLPSILGFIHLLYGALKACRLSVCEEHLCLLMVNLPDVCVHTNKWDQCTLQKLRKNLLIHRKTWIWWFPSKLCSLFQRLLHMQQVKKKQEAIWTCTAIHFSIAFGEVWCFITQKHFSTNSGFKGKSERENTAIDLPLAITEVFELNMQVQLFLKGTITLPAEED